MKRYDYRGKTVLVTGASMGLGAAFARDLVRRGAEVILVARSEPRLRALADELGKGLVIAEDLSAPGAVARVHQRVREAGLHVDVLINNAGFGLHAAFDGLPIERQRGQIELNVTALVELTHAFLPEIEARGGGVLLVASMAGYQATPYMAVYGATKAFVLSFGLALWAELRPRGVRVTVLSPGATETSFFDGMSSDVTGGMAKARPEDVVTLGLEALARGRSSVIHGATNRVAAFATRLVSRELSALAIERIAKPRTPPRLP